MEKWISHFYSQATKRARTEPEPSTPGKPALEAPATAPTIEETAAVTMEAGAGAAGGRAAAVDAVTRAASGDAVAAKVVAASGDAGDQ